MKYDCIKVICVCLCCVFTLFSCVGTRRSFYHENKTTDTVTLAAARKSVENIRSSVMDTVRVYQRGDTVFSDKIRVYYYQRTNTDTTTTAEKNKSVSTSTTEKEQKGSNVISIKLFVLSILLASILPALAFLFAYRRR